MFQFEQLPVNLKKIGETPIMNEKIYSGKYSNLIHLQKKSMVILLSLKEQQILSGKMNLIKSIQQTDVIL
ncbi:hypothetical protein [Fusobacterium varium]